MDKSSTDFGRLMERVRGGSHLAAQQMHDLFESKILKTVRRKLPRVLRTKYDSQDFVQDAWRIMWEKYLRHASFSHRGAFASVLNAIAESIVIDTVRQRLKTSKYNVNREQTLDTMDDNEKLDPPDPQPTPSKFIIRDEELQKLLDKQPPVFRHILIQHCEGASISSIAADLGVCERTIKRILDKIQEQHNPQCEQ